MVDKADPSVIHFYKNKFIMSNNLISLNEAISLTRRYRDNKKKILAPDYQDRDVLAICETFDRSAFDLLLATPGCTGVRVYYGMSSEDQVKAVIVGVNAQNDDILPGSAAGDPTILDQSWRCP